MNRLAIMGAVKLSSYFKNSGRMDVFKKYNDILDEDSPVQYKDKLDDFSIFSKKDLSSARIMQLLSYCGENKIAVCAIQLAILSYMNQRACQLFRLIADDEKPELTLNVVGEITYGYGCSLKHVRELSDAYERLKLFLIPKEHPTDIFRSNIVADSRIISFLAGEDVLDSEFDLFAECYAPGDFLQYPYGCKEELQELSDLFQGALSYNIDEEDAPDIKLVISGESESGRFTLLKHLAEEYEFPIFAVKADIFTSTKEVYPILWKIRRECLLMECVLCIRNIKADEKHLLCVDVLVQEYLALGGRPIFLVCEKQAKLLPKLNGMIIDMEISAYSAQKSIEIWDGYLKNEPYYSNINISELVSKMKLTAGQIKRICMLLKTYSLSASEPVITNALVYQYCYKVLDDGRYENVKRIKSDIKLSDLKLSPKNMSILHDICNQVRYQETVFSKWDLERKYPYGRCISALLVGPPGVGKTMTVYALANELGLELYKVDLSQIVDKYIGETEKRLEEVFENAEKCNMLLFFDEADALFGKRNETKNSNDKYANSEVAYLLQRIEEYNGIVLLSTNIMQNIDTAFIRRIRYVLHYNMPDETIRREIWESVLSNKVPIASDIDFDYLAQHFELSGGNIKNIVLNAAFYAAADKAPVSMEHIIKAMVMENTKDKRVSFIENYGEYAYLVNRI